ncbi:hypothetical protein N1I81_07645 [Bacillus sp. FSL M8-0052]|uniref:hypothetical protein n=1 Tax=Bacillus sp. FSL M8-0052 TaxID=2978203 RepID=UPI0026A11A68
MIQKGCLLIYNKAVPGQWENFLRPGLHSREAQDLVIEVSKGVLQKMLFMNDLNDKNKQTSLEED